MSQLDLANRNKSLSATQKILDILENNGQATHLSNAPESPVKQVKTKFAQDIEYHEKVDLELMQGLLEKIQTELYRIDQSPDYQNLAKKYKDTLVSRKIVDYLLYQDSAKQPTAEAVKNALYFLMKNIEDCYTNETIRHCYDRINCLEYADLYKPEVGEIPERFSKLSEFYEVSWELDQNHKYEGTLEVIRYPAITLENPLELTRSVLNILDEVAKDSKEYIPISLEDLKKHFLNVDYINVFRQKKYKDNGTYYKVVGVTVGVRRHSDLHDCLIYSPGIISTKHVQASLGLFLGVMIAKSSPDFGKKELSISGFTQNKKVLDIMKICNPDPAKIFISGLHWRNLTQAEKEKLNKIIVSSSGKPKKHLNNYVLDENGIDVGRYPKNYRADIEPMPIKVIPLNQEDAIFVINKVPQNINSWVTKNTVNPSYKNRFFGQFIKALKIIKTFKKID